jgi:uncharacterized protein (TIGR02996 family)
MNHEAFLAAIRDNREDDTTRLVYADWLDEQGDAARADFIRTQVRLAALDEDDPARPELEQRERQLLAAHEARWLGPLPPTVHEWSFRGGFVDRLVFGGQEGLLGAEDLLARHPVRELVLGPCVPPFNVAGSSFLAAVSALDFRAILPPAFTRALACSPHLARLSSLAVRGERLGEQFFKTLAGPTWAPRLKALALESPALRDARVSALLRGPHLRELSELAARGPDLSGSLLAEMAGPEHGARWVGLSWHNRNGYGSASIPRLVNCVNLRKLSLSMHGPAPKLFPALPALTDLELRDVGHAEALYRLAASGSLSNLRRLVLSFRRYLDEPMCSALESVLWGLSRPALRLPAASFYDRQIQALGRSAEPAQRLAAISLVGELSTQAVGTVTRFTHLEDLDIQLPSSQGGAILDPLLRSPSLSRLRRLSLGLPADQASACLCAIAQSPHLRRLRELWFLCDSQGQRGLVALAEWPGLAGLDVLVLGTGMNDAMLRPLAESPYLSPLTRLVLIRNHPSSRLAEVFRSRLGRRYHQ